MVSKLSSLLEEIILVILFFFHIVYVVAEEHFQKGKRFVFYYGKIAIKPVIVFVAGEVAQPVDKFYFGVHTVHPNKMLTESQWLNQYHVSFMHGWRSNPIYIENHEISNNN